MRNGLSLGRRRGGNSGRSFPWRSRQTPPLYPSPQRTAVGHSGWSRPGYARLRNPPIALTANTWGFGHLPLVSVYIMFPIEGGLFRFSP